MIPATVLMPTSAIPAHPDTAVIDETVASVRERLPAADLIVMADGIAPAVGHRRAEYHEYLRRITWAANHRWGRACVQVHERHVHQVGMVRHVLPTVSTPLVLFVEHDTPLVGDVDWQGCAAAIGSGAANVVRYYHEAILHPEHAVLARGPVDNPHVPLLATVQWSQRPHLASTEVYRQLMDGPWWEPTDGMVEDRLHVVAQAYPWARWKVALYAPEGDIQRSAHLDGRGGDPKVTLLDGVTA